MLGGYLRRDVQGWGAKGFRVLRVGVLRCDAQSYLSGGRLLLTFAPFIITLPRGRLGNRMPCRHWVTGNSSAGAASWVGKTHC
jgi:hypothetical protein